MRELFGIVVAKLTSIYSGFIEVIVFKQQQQYYANYDNKARADVLFNTPEILLNVNSHKECCDKIAFMM